MELCSSSNIQNPAAQVDNFPQFDVVTDASDHHYINYKKSVSGTESSLYKRIMNEWKILQKNLPESIYVRVYEGRIDLLRAVIVGAGGTPYHDGLFFFDIAFPSDYPNRPPLVNYRSFGLYLNPNLYASGYVCLSLINTWSGPRWEVNRSTILQVLISLQGLVLNDSPFFNEPVYSGKSRKLFDKMSRDYNNNAFVMSLKTMVYLLRRPPKNFQGFIADHFTRRGRHILTACQAYTHGFVRIGGYRDGGRSNLPERVKVSKRFLTMMDVQYPLLVNEFTRNDASLNGFLVELNQIVKRVEDEYKEKAKVEKSKIKKSKLSRILKKFLGCAISKEVGAKSEEEVVKSNENGARNNSS